MDKHEDEALAKMIEALGDGHFEQRIDGPEGSDAFVDMAGRLNQLAARLEATSESESEQLRRSEQSYREIFDSATDMIFIQDLETGAFLDVNAETVRATGYSVEEYRAMDVGEFSPPSSEYDMQKALSHIGLAAQGEPQMFEWAYVDKQGKVHPTEVHLKRAEINGQHCLLGITRDITERKEAEAERKLLEQKVLQAQRFESLGLLAGGVAHDFNNILMGVLGHSSLALSELPPHSPVRNRIRKIEVAANRAAELVSQMLAFTGREQLTLEPVDLSTTVEEIGQLLYAAASKKAQLTFDIDDSLPQVIGNPSSIRQVVMNLFTNASEALEGEAGTISLKTGIVEMSEEQLADTYIDWSRPAGRYCYVEVADNGCGMDSEILERIFDPFFTRKKLGRGLGLAATLGIVRSHQGAIDVVSVPGEGTTFRVLLPCSEGAGPTVRPAPEAAVGTSALRGCVLIVDDEEIVREAAKSYLETHGIEVLLASDGSECLSVYWRERERVSAILLDVSMPGMSGPETLRELRRAGAEVPVIMSSGYVERQVQGGEDSLKPQAFLGKPYSPEKLLAVLSEVLG